MNNESIHSLFSFFCCEYGILNFSPSLWLANETNHKTSSCLELMAVCFITIGHLLVHMSITPSFFWSAMGAKGLANKTKERLASSKS